MPRLKDVIADWVDHNDGPFIRPTAEELANEVVNEAIRNAVANTSYDPAIGEYSMRRIPAPLPSWYGRGMEDFVDRPQSITDAVRESAAERVTGAMLSPEDIDWTRAALLSRPPESMWVYPTMYGEMGRLDPQYRTGMCTRCGEVRECETRLRSTLIPAVEYPGGGDPDPNVLVCGECLERMARPNAVIARVLHDNEYLPPLDQPVPIYTNGQPVDRPAHYAVASNRCSCGFRALPRNVDMHIQGNTERIGQRIARHRAENERLRAELNAQSAAEGNPVRSADLHYRVGEGGRCACGFESMFTGEMDSHIDQGNTGEVKLSGEPAPPGESTAYMVQVGDSPSGWENAPVASGGGNIPRRWFFCSRCKSYRPCREWRSAVYSYRGFADTEALLPPNGPEFETEYLCNRCLCGPTPPDADPSLDGGWPRSGRHG